MYVLHLQNFNQESIFLTLYIIIISSKKYKESIEGKNLFISFLKLKSCEFRQTFSHLFALINFMKIKKIISV